MAVADTATMDAGVATLGAITTTASMVVATTTTTVAATATPVAATAIMVAATATPAITTVTLVVTMATPVIAVVKPEAQVAVATTVAMGAEALTATEAVDPAAADIGNSPEFFNRKGTAGSRCCQPFSIVMQFLVRVGDNPILPPTAASAETSLTGSAKMGEPR